MAKLLTTKGIAFFLDELFKSSKEYVNIITPYFKIDKQLEERILEASDNGLKITFIFGKDKEQLKYIKPELRNKLVIMFYENLHAKFYMNEQNVLITSMNMHAFSQANNREIGVLFTKKDSNDLQVIQDCLKEFQSIKKQSQTLYATPLKINENYPHSDITNLNYETSGSIFHNKFHTTIKSIIIGKLGVKEKDIVPNARLVEDLGADSLDLVELVMEIEKEFDIAINDEDAENIKTIKQLVQYIDDRKINNSSPTKTQTETYGYEEFKSKWIDHLVECYHDIKFNPDNESILAKDFPLKNIDFSLQYGFATLKLSSTDQSLKRLKNDMKLSLEEKLKNYRLYWNQNQISIYHAKDISFKSVKDDIDYCSQALNIIIREMKNINFN